MCESTRAFIVTQFGLSCFERLEGGSSGSSGRGGGPAEYQARTFNFWIFPQVGGGRSGSVCAPAGCTSAQLWSWAVEHVRASRSWVLPFTLTAHPGSCPQLSRPPSHHSPPPPMALPACAQQPRPQRAGVPRQPPLHLRGGLPRFFERAGANEMHSTWQRGALKAKPVAAAGTRWACSTGDATELSESTQTRCCHQPPFQGFDFNTCIGKGIPYMPARQRDNLIKQVGPR
jgi:hypothetical protein